MTELVTSFQHLMKLAAEVGGGAKKRGNEEEITAAIEIHDEYKNICLKADKMSLGISLAQLNESIQLQKP